MLALFVQTMVSNKFIGHGIVIGMVVLVPILFNFGWSNTLYLVGQVPAYTYSDMNGYGHFVPALFYAVTYWVAIFAALGVISIAFTRRGAETSLRARAWLARGRASRLIPAFALFLVDRDRRGLVVLLQRARAQRVHERGRPAPHPGGLRARFKKYELLPQPKVTAVNATVDIYPERRSFSGTGKMTLQNKSTQPMSQIHLVDEQQAVSKVSFDRPFHLVSQAPRDLYSIYQLEQPLEPGEVLTMTFHVETHDDGFP